MNINSLKVGTPIFFINNHSQIICHAEFQKANDKYMLLKYGDKLYKRELRSIGTSFFFSKDELLKYYKLGKYAISSKPNDKEQKRKTKIRKPADEPIPDIQIMFEGRYLWYHDERTGKAVNARVLKVENDTFVFVYDGVERSGTFAYEINRCIISSIPELFVNMEEYERRYPAYEPGKMDATKYKEHNSYQKKPVYY